MSVSLALRFLYLLLGCNFEAITENSERDSRERNWNWSWWTEKQGREKKALATKRFNNCAIPPLLIIFLTYIANTACKIWARLEKKGASKLDFQKFLKIVGFKNVVNSKCSNLYIALIDSIDFRYSYPVPCSFITWLNSIKQARSMLWDGLHLT